MQDMSDLRKSIAERLGSAAKSERPGAKAKFSMQFEVGKTYEHSFANDSDSRVMWKVMARSGSMLTIKQVASGYRVKTNDPSEYRHGVSAVNGETKRVKIYSDERGEYVYPMGRYSMAPSIRATDIARGFSRPGAKAKFEQAAWMSNVQQFLRNLTAEKQRIRVWIGGPTTVHVAGAWQQHRGPFGLGAAIANRTAYWLQQAARQAGSTASMEGEDRKDQPRKGVTTTIWTVKDIPAEAVAYLKAWGIGTTPQAFAGFTGQSAVAYSRPGAKAKMGEGLWYPEAKRANKEERVYVVTLESKTTGKSTRFEVSAVDEHDARYQATAAYGSGWRILGMSMKNARPGAKGSSKAKA